MTVRSGMAGQIGYADEATVGTFAAPTVYVPLIGEKMTRKDDRLESKAIIPGRRLIDTNQHAAGKQMVGGSVQHELYDRDVVKLFKHAFGAVNTTGAGPYVHTFTLGDHQTMKALTCQVGKPGTGGTVHPFSYLGTKINKLQIGCKAGEIATLGLDLLCMTETTAQSLGTASYSPPIPMTFVGATATIAGAAVKCKSATWTLDNKFKNDRFFNGQASPEEIQEEDLTDITSVLIPEFVDLTHYTRVTAFTSAAVVLTFAAGSYSLAITMNCRFDGETPNVAGGKILDQPLQLKAHGTTDALGCTAVFTTTNATA